MQQDPGPACSSKADNLILYILCSLSFLLWRMQHKLNSEFWNVKLTNLKHNLKPMWAFFTHIFFYICQVETFKVCLVSLLYWKCNLASNHNNEMLDRNNFFFLALTSPNNFKFRLSKSLSCVPVHISVVLSYKHTGVSFFFPTWIGGNIKLQVYVHLRLNAARI